MDKDTSQLQLYQHFLAHLQSSVSHYPKILHNLNMKNGRSDTPLS